MTGVLLNVADIRHRSRVNGPGVRSVVWVQGCSIGCPDCFNPHTHPHRPVRLVDPVKLGRRLSHVEGSTGITISGGEPFEQAEACAALATIIHRSRLSVMVFTGYQYAHLRRCAHPAVREFLTSIDILVAGPYVARLETDGSFWRASSNQTVHGLSQLGREAIAAARHSDPVVEIVTDGGHLACTGFPTHEDRLWLGRLQAPAVHRARCDRQRSNAE